MCCKPLLIRSIVYISICNGISVEARVYCQDSNAKPWIPLGFTCPVVCATVLNAIERLIMSDYKRTVKDQLSNRLKLSSKISSNEINYIDNYITIDDAELRRKILALKNNDGLEANFDNDHKNHTQRTHTELERISARKNKNGVEAHFDTVHKNNKQMTAKVKHDVYNEINIKTAKSDDPDKLDILASIKNATGILRRNARFEINNIEDHNENNIEDGKCWYLEKFKVNLLIGKVVRRKCSRRSNFDTKFVSVMTNVLNKYVDSLFRFTDEMTEILLENIFGKNADLRNNIFDVNKLLNYLRKSIDRHKIHSHKQIITLKSRHCLTVSMPGCFCRPGYVESSGQCVKPEDCVINEEYLQYLPRIVIL